MNENDTAAPKQAQQPSGTNQAIWQVFPYGYPQPYCPYCAPRCPHCGRPYEFHPWPQMYPTPWITWTVTSTQYPVQRLQYP